MFFINRWPLNIQIQIFKALPFTISWHCINTNRKLCKVNIWAWNQHFFKSYCTTHFYSVHFLTRLSLVSNNASWTLIVSLAHIYVHFSNFQIVLSFLVYELSPPSVFGIWTFSSFSFWYLNIFLLQLFLCMNILLLQVFSYVWTFFSFKFSSGWTFSFSFWCMNILLLQVFSQVSIFSSFRFLMYEHSPPSGFFLRFNIFLLQVFGVWTFSSFSFFWCMNILLLQFFLVYEHSPPSGFWCMNILLWSDVHVYDHMAIECWLLVEALATYLTHEGPFPSVRSPMHG